MTPPIDIDSTALLRDAEVVAHLITAPHNTLRVVWGAVGPSHHIVLSPTHTVPVPHHARAGQVVQGIHIIRPGDFAAIRIH